MNLLRFAALATLVSGAAAAQPAPQPCAGLPPGRHSLLERMTAGFGLTCAQQLQIEPLLHDEESVTKPLLRFTSFSLEQRQAVMLKVKLAARRQIRSLLAPHQQQLLDQDMEDVAKGADRGGRGGARKPEVPVKTETLEDEEVLSRAVTSYAALTAVEKRSMLLEIKRAARADGDRRLAPDQQRKLDSEIAELAKR
jgi:hypothetical protein